MNTPNEAVAASRRKCDRLVASFEAHRVRLEAKLDFVHQIDEDVAVPCA